MKRIASILLTAVLAITSCGIGVFADDAKAAEQPKTRSVNAKRVADPYNLANWNFHLKTTTFEYDPGEFNRGRGKYYGKHEELANLTNILNQLQYNAKVRWFNKKSDISFTLDNETYYYDESDYVFLKPGKYTLLIKAEDPDLKGSVKIPFEVKPFEMTAQSTGVVSNNGITYTGKKLTPKIPIYLKTPDKYRADYGGNDFRWKECTMTRKYSNNKNVGIGMVTMEIKFKNDFTGTVTKTAKFVIHPRNPKYKKIKTGKHSATIKWKKEKSASGYKVEVRKCRTGKTVKSRTFKSNKKTSLKVSGLKKHTKYAVEISSYKNVKGKKIKSVNGRFKTFRTK